MPGHAEPSAGAPTYTHGYGAAVLGSHRARTAENSAAHLLPHLHDGQRLLDVGSGAGTITADLARIVGPRNLTALEVTEDAAALTRSELQRQGVDEVEVVVGDAHALAFADRTFDVVHAHQVLQHVPRPVTALAEFCRVTRPGGIVAVRDSDYEGFRWYPETPGIARWIALYLRAARANGGTPDAGRRLLAWAHEAGFEEAAPGASTWLYATPEAREHWARTWAGRVTSPPLAEQLQREGWADADERAAIAEDFRRWAEDPDGWFSVLHGEVLARA
ncbi:methyltransferase domain-containing protein [Brachybacterium sacelli]|uniref:Ubiquinone/menaquinone biosynthesis C-methylase UbiE n=1 Tax=Brachybacterium sacelli TaxID=173364 RepID=A0ABS4WYI9_9MICO|nr:methyltransferase domain-containing protein [Brachybacterium sacelli]MBP2380574.1 ubiquinone/menaquinone biosynthesis C-methylase UbiE [Brachybacterium sacelli]